MEQYIKIKDFPSYEVSDLGNVRNLKGRVLVPAPDQKGYLMIGLRKEGKTYTKRLARIVANHFIPNPLNKPQINHKNGDKTDNSVKNLEWNTGSENITHAYKELKRKGSQTGKQYGSSPFSKKLIQLSKEGKEIKIWDSMKEAAEFFGIKRQSITSCINGKCKTVAGFKWKLYE